MKYLKSYKIFENQGNEVPIEKFLQEIEIPNYKHPIIIDWWLKNMEHIKIHHFEFSSSEPIIGVVLGENEIAINKNFNHPKLQLMPQHIKQHIRLFVALHESKHCDQHSEKRFSNLYFDPVKEGDKDRFFKNYFEIEKEANDFAINSLKEMGFVIKDTEWRGNESEESAEKVYEMMRIDIERLNPTDMIDLYRKQVL